MSDPGPSSGNGPPTPSPFHPGEQAVQKRLGVRERIEQTGRRIVRTFMAEDHRELFRKLPCLFVSSRDDERRIWASLLLGEPGFVTSGSAGSLEVQAKLLPNDPLRGAALGKP